MSNMEKKFEADTGKILDIVINSLYSEREIFVRELISNASDAIDKKKYLALTNKSINDTSDPFEIKIEVNSCLLYTSPSPRDRYGSRMPSSA